MNEKNYEEPTEIKELEIQSIKSNDFFGTSYGGQFGSDRGYEAYQQNCD